MVYNLKSLVVKLNEVIHLEIDQKKWVGDQTYISLLPVRVYQLFNCHKVQVFRESLIDSEGGPTVHGMAPVDKVIVGKFRWHERQTRVHENLLSS